MNVGPNIVFERTESGVAEMEANAMGLSRSARLLLIMVNGESSVGEIAAKLYSIPLRRLIEALENMRAQGLIQRKGEGAAVGRLNLKREAIEAFLAPADLDPSTAMIANFEVDAALAQSSTEINSNKKQAVEDARAHSSLEAKLEALVSERKAASEASLLANTLANPNMPRPFKPMAEAVISPRVDDYDDVRVALDKKQTLALSASNWAEDNKPQNSKSAESSSRQKSNVKKPKRNKFTWWPWLAGFLIIETAVMAYFRFRT